MLRKIFRLKSKNIDSEKLAIDYNSIPQHIAIIMDGNGRWAKRRGMPRIFGHNEGAKVLYKIVEAADEAGVKSLTVYAFSTENWRRPQDEVGFLMELILKKIDEHLAELMKKNVQWNFIGRIKQLDDKLQNWIANAEEKTRNNTGLKFNIALNYGGRAEIADSLQQIMEKVSAGELKIDQITEDTISQHLYQPEMSDVDLLIRPSGDMRISNFLLWQIAYAEIWTTDLCWPDFTKQTLLQAIADYQKRERRFGGIK